MRLGHLAGVQINELGRRFVDCVAETDNNKRKTNKIRDIRPTPAEMESGIDSVQKDINP